MYSLLHADLYDTLIRQHQVIFLNTHIEKYRPNLRLQASGNRYMKSLIVFVLVIAVLSSRVSTQALRRNTRQEHEINVKKHESGA